DTIRGALQELEDVLHHVAARGGGMAPATHLVPLHLGPEHQARSLRAGRRHEPEDGHELRRCARRASDLLYLRLEHATHRPAAVAEGTGVIFDVSAAAGSRNLQPQWDPGGG